MADKPNFPLILGVPMFIDDVRVNPEYVKEVMKYVKYKTTSHYPELNNVTSIAHFADGFTLGIGESPTVFGSVFDENVGKHYAQRDAVTKAQAKVYEMLGSVLYFKASNVLTVRDPGDMSGDVDQAMQTLWREKWGFGEATYDAVQDCQNKYTGKKATLYLEQLDSTMVDSRYGYMALVMNLPALPTANSDVWTTDDFKFIYNYSPEKGVTRVVMVYYMNFFQSATGKKIRTEFMQVIDGAKALTRAGDGQDDCVCTEPQIPGGDLIRNESEVGEFVSDVAVKIIEKFLKDDLKGRYRDPFPAGK